MSKHRATNIDSGKPGPLGWPDAPPMTGYVTRPVEARHRFFVIGDFVENTVLSGVYRIDSMADLAHAARGSYRLVTSGLGYGRYEPPFMI